MEQIANMFTDHGSPDDEEQEVFPGQHQLQAPACDQVGQGFSGHEEHAQEPAPGPC